MAEETALLEQYAQILQNSQRAKGQLRRMVQAHKNAIIKLSAAQLELQSAKQKAAAQLTAHMRSLQSKLNTRYKQAMDLLEQECELQQVPIQSSMQLLSRSITALEQSVQRLQSGLHPSPKETVKQFTATMHQVHSIVQQGQAAIEYSSSQAAAAGQQGFESVQNFQQLKVTSSGGIRHCRSSNSRANKYSNSSPAGVAGDVSMRNSIRACSYGLQVHQQIGQSSSSIDSFGACDYSHSEDSSELITDTDVQQQQRQPVWEALLTTQWQKQQRQQQQRQQQQWLEELGQPRAAAYDAVFDRLQQQHQDQGQRQRACREHEQWQQQRRWQRQHQQRQTEPLDELVPESWRAAPGPMKLRTVGEAAEAAKAAGLQQAECVIPAWAEQVDELPEKQQQHVQRGRSSLTASVARSAAARTAAAAAAAPVGEVAAGAASEEEGAVLEEWPACPVQECGAFSYSCKDDAAHATCSSRPAAAPVAGAASMQRADRAAAGVSGAQEPLGTYSSHDGCQAVAAAELAEGGSAVADNVAGLPTEPSSAGMCAKAGLGLEDLQQQCDWELHVRDDVTPLEQGWSRWRKRISTHLDAGNQQQRQQQQQQQKHQCAAGATAEQQLN